LKTLCIQRFFHKYSTLGIVGTFHGVLELFSKTRRTTIQNLCIIIPNALPNTTELPVFGCNWAMTFTTSGHACGDISKWAVVVVIPPTHAHQCH